MLLGHVYLIPSLLSKLYTMTRSILIKFANDAMLGENIVVTESIFK
jgi:hypothetical protein